MSDNKRTPQIRFKGFTDDWEQRKLSDCTTFRRGSFPQPYGKAEWYDGNESMPFVQVADVGNDMKLVNETKQRISKVAQPMSVFIPKKSVIVTLQGTIGRVAITQYDAYLDRTVLYFDSYKNPINKNFWSYIIKNKFLEEAKSAPGGTIKTITKEVLSNFDLKMPIEVEEQNKIGECFNQIDNLITLHQRKCDKLVNMKKSMLEKMFPKNSEKVPEIRFKGFTDDWEQRKLDKLLEQYTEVTTINDQYPALTSSRKGIFFQTEYFAGNQIASQNNVGYNIVPRNYFTYRHMSDDEIFHFNINNICDFGIVSTLYPVFTTKKELDSKYLQYQLNYGTEFAKFATLQKQGGSRTYMYFAKLRELELTIPKIEEQKKISAILSNVDNLIALHQRKLEKLNSLKKSMLEKMFA